MYTTYRKAGYSKALLEAHREKITLHKAAKAAFDEAGLQKLPKVKELDAEFSELLTKKKAAYPDYRKARARYSSVLLGIAFLRFRILGYKKSEQPFWGCLLYTSRCV